MRRRLLLFSVLGLGLSLATLTCAFGQTASSKNPEFDVATVKPSAPLDMAKLAAEVQAGHMPKIGPHVEGTRAEYNYMSLRDLIATAYKLKPFQVSGPDWLASQRFDISAKLPDGASTDDAPAMLQTLLVQRFHLVAHSESAEHPVLGLVVGKNGPKLKASPEKPEPIDESAPLKPGEMKMDTPNGPARVMRNPDGSSTVNMGSKGVITQKMDMQSNTLQFTSSSVTMAGFADMLTSVMQMGGGGNSRQVVDMTDLKGNYQVTLNISLSDLMAMARANGMGAPPLAAPATQDLTASDPSGNSTVFESVQALGLKLEARKAKIEQLIVESVSKTATEN